MPNWQYPSFPAEENPEIGCLFTLTDLQQKHLLEEYQTKDPQVYPPEVAILLDNERAVTPGNHDFCDFLDVHAYTVAPPLTNSAGENIITVAQHWQSYGIHFTYIF